MAFFPRKISGSRCACQAGRNWQKLVFVQVPCQENSHYMMRCRTVMQHMMQAGGEPEFLLSQRMMLWIDNMHHIV